MVILSNHEGRRMAKNLPILDFTSAEKNLPGFGFSASRARQPLFARGDFTTQAF